MSMDRCELSLNLILLNCRQRKSCLVTFITESNINFKSSFLVNVLVQADLKINHFFLVCVFFFMTQLEPRRHPVDLHSFTCMA